MQSHARGDMDYNFTDFGVVSSNWFLFRAQTDRQTDRQTDTHKCN